MGTVVHCVVSVMCQWERASADPEAVVQRAARPQLEQAPMNSACPSSSHRNGSPEVRTAPVGRGASARLDAVPRGCTLWGAGNNAVLTIGFVTGFLGVRVGEHSGVAAPPQAHKLSACSCVCRC